MTITLLQEATGIVGAVTGNAVTMPAPLTNGSALVAVQNQSSSVTSATLFTNIVVNAGSATWVKAAAFPSNADPPTDAVVGLASTVQFAYALNIVGGGTVITFTQGTARANSIRVYEFAGVDPLAIALAAFASDSTGGSVGSLTQLGAPVSISRGGVVVCGMSTPNGTSTFADALCTPTTGWVSAKQDVPLTAMNGNSAYRIFTADQANAQAVWTHAPNQGWGTATIALLEPPPVVVPPRRTNPYAQVGARSGQAENALGCGQYRAAIWTRGGGTLLYDSLPVTDVQWNRVLSDTSDASCNLAGIGLSPECTSAIRDTWPWEHELALTRDPGGLVWMGPVVKTGSKFTTGKIEGRDLSAWWDRRNLPISRTYTDVDLATIFNELALDAEVEDPFGLGVEATATGVLASRIYRAGNYLLAGAQLRELTKAGVDWTLIAREALVGGIVVPADPIVFLQDSHIREAPQVDRDGLAAFANRAVTSGAGGGEQDNPIVGVAEDGTSIAIYGLAVETANVDAIRDVASAQATSQSRVDLVGTPAVILGDVTLAPTAPVLIGQLVPGAVVSCAFASSGIPVAGSFRLQKVSVTGQGDGERVVLSLQPVGAGGTA